MSNQILKELYYDNLSPKDRQIVKGSELAHLVGELSEAEGLLAEALTPELRPVLKRITDAQIALNSLTAETYYIDGFKTGARFILAIQDNTLENLEPIQI